MVDMTDAPQVLLPAGMKLEQDADGNWAVKVSREFKTKTIGWRVPPSQYAGYLPFLEAFPERTWAAAFTWLMDQPEVNALIAEKVASAVIR